MRNSIKAVLALTMVTGCAPDVTTVDRTQPNAIDKAQFEGIWYHRATIVEADPEAGDTEGLTSTSEKIRWEITEGLLIGYRSYEFVPYAEGLTDEGRDFFGAPVAAFAILKHFDIQRDYNATTGVESNVVVENDEDRPWFERQYMRIDWSINLVGRQTNFWTGWVNYPDGYLSGDALAKYYVQGHEETDINRPLFTQDYFDVTNIYALSPDPYYCSVILLYNQVPRCGLGNVKVRLSFRKVNPADDYESLYYPDYVELKDDAGNAIITNFDGRSCDNYDPGACTVKTYPMDAAFGNFRVMRAAFDQERFLTRTGRIYMAGRHNIWKDTFNEDGSTIPYEQREPKPIVYVANVQFPYEVWEPAQRMAQSYNIPFSETVAIRKKYFQADGKPDVARLRNEMGQDMYQFVKNTCNSESIVEYARANGYEDVVTRIAGSGDRVAIGNVEQVCAAVQYAELQDGKTLDKAYAEKTGTPLAFTWERKGDLRYNFQNYINQVQWYGPWGVAQFGQDPETGMFYGNAANYFGDAGDTIAQSEVDVIQWINGDLTEEELFRGDITRREVVSRRENKNSGIRQDVKQMLKSYEDQLAEGEELFNEGTADEEDRRFASMWGNTDVEKDFLVNDELLRGFAGPTLYQPFGAADPQGIADLIPGDVTQQAMDAARPSTWGITSETNPFMKAAYEFGRAGFDMADFFDPNTAGLAEYFKGDDREEIYQWMRAELFGAVNGHEVGHTVGLRHNFEASMDPQNYRPEFWWLEKDGNVIQYWNNPPSEGNEHRGNEYKYASIMDYAFDIPLEGFSGLGMYDMAAIRFMYGQIEEVWDPSKVSIPDPRKYGSFARRCGHDSDFWGLPGLMFWLLPEHIPVVLSQGAKDQSPCAGNYDGNQACDSEMDKLFRELVVRVESNAENANLPSSCALFIGDVNWIMDEVKKFTPNAQNVYGARKFVTVEDLITQRIEVLTNPPEYDDVGTESADESTNGNDEDGDGTADDKGFDWSQYQYPVSYAYCSDLYANFSIPSCQRWDAGWDFVEATENHVNRWDRDYVFDHFRRDQLYGWGSPRGYMARLQSRRFFHMTNVFRYYLFVRRTAFEAPRYDDWRDAAYRGLNFLERVLQTPEPGRYCLNGARNVFELDRTGTRAPCDQEYVVGLGAGAGRHLNTSWTDEYIYKPNRIGDFYDKLAAIQQMTTSSGRFVRDFSDLFNRRAYSLGYLRVYLDPMLQRWSSLVTGDFEGYRSHVVTDPDTQDRYVRYMPLFDEELNDGSSVRAFLNGFPQIEPSWSYNLRYMALAYGLANWSSINDYAPEFYRFSKISIRGTPEDITYPADFDVEEFTDPETFITYVAPVINPVSPPGLISEFPAYYGDSFHRSQGKFHYWGMGAVLLQDANTFMTDVWTPAKTACDNSSSPASTECETFQRARTEMSEKVGYIDLIRKFNHRAEATDDY